jgi:hypothetical protein
MKVQETPATVTLALDNAVVVLAIRGARHASADGARGKNA